ncbi:unnamed protein product [Schistosoma mattheei]|uniref:Uncharacterized protein n=1 Tax=Schistosoma mattheei TaxID=31246 RepID=A0A183P4B5_9TREM|nr:unnamed protein product [Schistosoma mattheei]
MCARCYWRHVLRLGNHTNNRNESDHKHLKECLRRGDSLLLTFWKIWSETDIDLRLRPYDAVKDLQRFPIPQFTSFAAKIVAVNCKRVRTMKHEFIGEYIRCYGKGMMYVVDTSRTRCACERFNDYMLPCGHILYACSKVIIRGEEEVLVAAVDVEAEVHKVFADAVSGILVTFETIKEASKKDNALKIVRHCILKKWPPSKSQRELLQYFRRRESLTVVDSCIMFGHCIVIPRNLQHRVIRQFHSGHPGISKMKSQAHSDACWPSMNHDIEQKCRSCWSCLEAMAVRSKLLLDCWTAAWIS